MKVFHHIIDDSGVSEPLKQAHRSMEESKAMWYLFLIEQMSQIGEEMSPEDWNNIHIERDDPDHFAFVFEGVVYETFQVELVG